MPPAPVVSFLTGYTRASGTVKARLILSVEALEGVGKTRFACTAPGPIAFLNLDNGLEGVIEPFQELKPIYVADINLDFPVGKDKTNEIIAAAERELAKFEAYYQTALKHARTIVIDTGTELWELIRLAAFGKLTQVLPRDYFLVNQQMRRLITLAYESSANLILTHRLKPEYIGERKTGAFEFAGMKEIPSFVQAHARLWTDDTGYHLRVNKCRQNATIVGLELVNELITFPVLAQFVFPNTTAADWE